ncbi:MAG: HAD hydrolase family protein [Lachnospiraceae bacterium]|nr:HAD hydrolase family protein [Lachnospiraceae bacterium]MBD5538250.1 HAD hydrolase family protein [Lachnospiraceae bacterium]
MNHEIRYVVFDVDGTLTDGKIYMGENGEVMKCFSIKDGCGIKDIMPKHNLVPIVITARKSQIVENRCKELGIDRYYQGCSDKVKKLDELAIELNCTQNVDGIYPEIAYMGDDIIDIPVMKVCGLKGCPNDAAHQVKEVADFVSTKNGGDGAAREFIEWLSV